MGVYIPDVTILSKIFGGKKAPVSVFIASEPGNTSSDVTANFANVGEYFARKGLVFDHTLASHIIA